MRSPELGVPLIPSVEQSPTPEQGREQIAAPAEQSNAEFAPAVHVAPQVTPVVRIAPTTSSVHQAIENILSEGLQKEYEQLDPATQQRFRQTGEETATQIESLLQSTKIQIQKIIVLITSWLKILPGVNSFFIQQEAKIKADKILKLHE